MWLTGGHYPDWIAEDVAQLRACERYHCLPSELEEEDWHVLARHRDIKIAENMYLRRDAEAKTARGRR